MASKPPRLPLREVLAAKVRAAREQRGWSQEQLAEQAGLSQVFISQVETAKAAATVDTIEKLAAGLDADASALLERN